MKTTAACPELSQCEKLITGQLPSPEIDSLLDHMASCDACVQQVEALLEKDTLVDLIRQARTLADAPPKETVARLVERIRKLRPGPASLAGASSKFTQPPLSKPNATGDGAGNGAPDANLTDFLAPPQADDELGRLGDYRVLRILGHGGMGVVFKAEDPKLKRTVAIKAMLPALAASASAGKRFLREAQAMAAVEHDHIVRIYQVAEDRGVPFLAMEFLKGEPLDERLKRAEQLSLAAILRLGREIARALDAAHKTGLIHRDIKPANIWLEAPEYRVKILDFGLARAPTSDAGLTQQGAIIGTPAYMAPEQARGDAVDFRCDLFSLGVVLYRLCTGKLPFVGADTVSTLMAVAAHEPPAPNQVNAYVPQELSDLVMKLLEKDPQGRPASAMEVAHTLQSLEKKLARQENGRDKSEAIIGSALQQGAGDRSLSASGDAATSDFVPARRRSRVMGLVALTATFGMLAVLSGTVFFWQTENGIVRIEINDDKIQVVFDKDGLKFAGVGKQDIQLTSGKYGFQVKRGDLDFHTDKLILKKGETTTLKIEWFEGKLLAFQDGHKIGEKTFVVQRQ
jgi:serine/threonine protein kinase